MTCQFLKLSAPLLAGFFVRDPRAHGIQCTLWVLRYPQTVPCVQAHTRVLLARQFLLHELHSVEELWDGEHFLSLPSSNLVLVMIGFMVLTAVTVTVAVVRSWR